MEARLQTKGPGQHSTSPAWFQELRPLCVEISQIAIRQPDSPEAARKLVHLTSQLHGVLQKADSGNLLGPKLAEYVFFPLSHIFRQLEAFPPPLIENSLRCLRVLIRYGWGNTLSGDLARQLLSLLVLIVDGKPGADRKAGIPEETLLEGFRSMSALFSVPHATSVAPSLMQNDFLPTTGHAISVILEALENAPYSAIQVAAAEVIQRAFKLLKSQDAYEGFLPGTVSAFAKVLSTPTKFKNAVLIESLSGLQTVLVTSMGDMRNSQAKWELVGKRPADVEESEEEAQYAKWLKASTAQIKLALGPVVKLNKSESPGIRLALYKLCIVLLDECHTSLWNCAPILLETAVILSEEAGDAPAELPSLTDLISIHPELGEILKATVYGWLTSLARQMQANDGRVRKAAFNNLARGINMLKKARISSSTLEDALTSSITDSMVVLLSQTGQSSVSDSAKVQLLTEGNNVVSNVPLDGSPYQKALINDDNTGGLRRSIIEYLGTISTLPQKTRVVETLLQNLQGSSSNVGVASLWLSFEMCKASAARHDDIDAMLNFGDDDDQDTALSELYSFSVDALSTHSDLDSGDWRIDFIAMEVVRHAAGKLGVRFRPELIDVLFPMATLLGSENDQLRQQAIATLNSLAISCQYGSVSELLIANVDYIVNSVSLRLNSLDISPASISVLMMIVRLAGPRLVPFLDDVVDSIFAALENYHGYTSFVEGLFAVLNEIVGSAVKSDRALLTSSDERLPAHRKTRAHTPGLQSVLRHIQNEKLRKKHDDVEDLTGKRPDGPFTRLAQEEEAEDEDGSNTAGQEIEKPSSPPTYQLLLRIANLTQHYLTSPTPKLRRSLLDVLSIAAPVLGANEDAFLPLVNSIWPVVFDRLYDGEKYVAIEACRALSSLCAAAGDFLGSRFKTVWWDGMGAWCRKCKKEAVSHGRRGAAAPRAADTGNIMLPFKPQKASGAQMVLSSTDQPDDGGLGQHASQVKLWEGIVGLLVAMVTYVRMDDEMFDEILELLADELERNPEAREALEVINADAVWLMRFERGKVEIGEPPVLDGLTFPDVRMLSQSGVSAAG
ncbi:HEAT repeat protein [Sarocladium implicatum]|nr:HEAT repeat protein [Sarocladium implicatum]